MSRAALSSADRMRASSLVVAPLTRTAVTATSDESRSHSQPPTPRPASTITAAKPRRNERRNLIVRALRRTRPDPFDAVRGPGPYLAAGVGGQAPLVRL